MQLILTDRYKAKQEKSVASVQTAPRQRVRERALARATGEGRCQEMSVHVCLE